jgi:hypothetical protein
MSTRVREPSLRVELDLMGFSFPTEALLSLVDEVVTPDSQL